MTSATASAVQRFTCKLPNGLHVRPAGELARIAGGFSASVTLRNLRTGATADAKSTLALLSSGVTAGDECELTASGPDAESALNALLHAVNVELPQEEVAYRTMTVANGRSLPAALRAVEAKLVMGFGVSRGISRGSVVRVVLQLPDMSGVTASSAAEEREKLSAAVRALQRRINDRTQLSAAAPASVLRAQLTLLQDAAFLEHIEAAILDGKSAGAAVASIAKTLAGQLRQSEVALVRERAADVIEISLELLRALYGDLLPVAQIKITEPSILVADELAPQQLLDVRPDLLRGIVLEAAAFTSHAVILAASLGVPAIVGARGALDAFAEGEQIFLDGNRGIAIQAKPTTGFYEGELRAEQSRTRAIMQRASTPATTADGQTMEIAANISSADEGIRAFAAGADGIGVFRTEFLFLGRNTSPLEEEQYAAYRQVIAAADGKPVIIRTFDIGGDKPVPYLHSEREANPFLGVRGARLYHRHEQLLQTQLCAILRAAEAGPVSVMAPMITNVSEAAEFRSHVEAAREQLAGRGIHAPAIPVGVMIEVPAVAFAIEQLAAHVEFFSVGANDLAQYFFAADRGNGAVAPLAFPRDPAFLRLLAHVSDASRHTGKWVGNCGDMAADPLNLPLLLGAGFDEISVPAATIADLKEQLRSLSAAKCKQLFRKAVALRSREEVDELLRAFEYTASQPLITPDLIINLDNELSKQDAVREIARALYITRRTDDPDEVESALRTREELASTAVTPGVAIPHCRSAAVRLPSICVLQASKPIQWEEENAVHTVIALLLPASHAADEHLRVLAKLARRLMDEQFRSSIAHLHVPTELVAFLGKELGL